MAQKKFRAPSDPRYPEGTILTVDIPDNKTDDLEYIDSALNNYVDARYGPKQPAIKPPSAITPQAVNKAEYLGQPALNRFGSGVVKGVTGLESVMPGHANPGFHASEGTSDDRIMEGDVQGEPYKNRVMRRFGMPNGSVTDLPVISNIKNALEGDVAGEAGQLTPALAGGAAAFSPKVRAPIVGAVKGIAANPPNISRFSLGGTLGALTGLLHDPSIHGMYTGAGIGAAAGGVGDILYQGMKGAVNEAKGVPWLGDLPKSPLDTTKPVTLSAKPQDISPVTKAEGQSAYSRKRLPAPDPFGDPNRTSGAIPMGPATPGRPNYPPGTAPESSTSASVAPWKYKQIEAGSQAIPMPPAGTSNITTLPTQRALPAPGTELRTQGAIPAGPAQVHDIPPTTIPVERGPVRPPVKGKEVTEPKKEVVESNKSKIEEKKVEEKKTPIQELVDKTKEKHSTKEHEKNTVTSPETAKESYSLGDIHSVAEKLGVTQSSVARWMIREGKTVERSKFGGWGEKSGKKDLDAVIDKIGTEKFEKILKDIKNK